MTERDEIGEYLTTTRFAKGRKIKRDQPIPRPLNIVETIFHIEQCYREQGKKGWDDGEQAENHRMLGLGAKTLTELTDDELEIVRSDMEKRKMILYEN